MAEVHPITEFGMERAKQWVSAPVVPLADKEKVRHIVRLQLATEAGWDHWVIGYCWGVDRNDNPVVVELGIDRLPRGERGAWSSALIKYFSSQGRYAKAMKVFEPGVIAKQW